MRTIRWLLKYSLLSVVVLAGVGGAPVGAAHSPGTVRFVSERRPVQGPGRELAVERPATVAGQPAPAVLSPDANPWRLQVTLPGTVIKDISFPNLQVGYIAAELG